jgi:hypothetical protein
MCVSVFSWRQRLLEHQLSHRSVSILFISYLFVNAGSCFCCQGSTSNFKSRAWQGGEPCYYFKNSRATTGSALATIGAGSVSYTYMVSLSRSSLMPLWPSLVFSDS